MMRGARAFFVLLALFPLVGASSAQEEKKAKKKVKDVEAVISSVGQRTITFQYEQKGKVREEAVGIDEKRDIERGEGEKIKLRDLQEGDKILLKYEPDAYTPAVSVKVVGKGEVQKAGGGDWRAEGCHTLFAVGRWPLDK